MDTDGLPHEEAQRQIYRGCARLAEAMKVKDLTNDAEKEWEKGALAEVMAVLRAVLTWHPVGFKFVIPPLPLALFEVYRQLEKRRPMRPSDVHSVYSQANTSRLAYMRPDEHDPGIPPDIGLGNPSTFWWVDLERRTPREPSPWLEDLVEIDLVSVGETDESDSEELAQKHRTGTKRTLTDSDESEESTPSHPCRRSSKRHRSESPSEDSDHECRYAYYPKCDSCEDQGWVCRVLQSKSNKLWGACSPCKSRRRGCSAIRGRSVVRKIYDKRNEPEKESILSRLRPRKSGSATSAFKPASSSNTPARPTGIQIDLLETTRRSSTSSGLSSPSLSLSSEPIARGSFATPASVTSSGPETTTTPNRELADKSVGTDGEALGGLNVEESEFLKGLVSLILQILQAHQSRFGGVKKEDHDS